MLSNRYRDAAFDNSLPIHKQPPLHCQELAYYPAGNPIFITGEYACLRTIRRFHGLCLFCRPPLMYTDLSCCYEREVWVLYSSSYWRPAIHLAQAIQQSGAAAISLICLGNQC
jgi:hypothetical protein